MNIYNRIPLFFVKLNVDIGEQFGEFWRIQQKFYNILKIQES